MKVLKSKLIKSFVLRYNIPAISPVQQSQYNNEILGSVGVWKARLVFNAINYLPPKLLTKQRLLAMLLTFAYLGQKV